MLGKFVLMIAMSVVFTLFSGCSNVKRVRPVVTKQLCQQANWRALGFSEAVKGTAPGAVRHYWQGCSAHGIVVDLNAYADGHNAGLGKYCNRAEGYRLGLKGEPYLNLCQGTLEPDFLRGYEQGKKVYEANHPLVRE